MKFPYDTTYRPPAPSVEVRFGIPADGSLIGPFKAFVDTGADSSMIPIQHIRQLGLKFETRKYLRSQWGESRRVNMYRVDLGIGNILLPAVEVVGDDRSDELIIGRNVLNKLILTLNGLRQTLEIRG